MVHAGAGAVELSAFLGFLKNDYGEDSSPSATNAFSALPFVLYRSVRPRERPSRAYLR